MATVQIRLSGNFDVASRLARRLEDAFELEGYPVTMEEVPAYSNNWTVDVILFDSDAAAARSAVAEALDDLAEGQDITAQILDDTTNWVAMSEDIRRPVIAGRFFLHGSHDRDKRPDGCVAIEIDAEMAFGTGHHASTWGCLVALDRVLQERSFSCPLDVGTGTGVLAIAIAKVLGVPVLATDIDPVAVQIAVDNARLNGVADKIETIVADGMKHVRLAQRAPYDLVMANILARPLTRLAAPICKLAAPGATIILAGLRVVDAPMVLSAWRKAGAAQVDSVTEAEWQTLILRTPPTPDR